MAENEGGFVDRVVDLIARGMDSLGLNGTRFRWRWNRRRREFGEVAMRAEMFARSTRGAHKMCPSCRALVPRSAGTCSECGTSLSRVRAPGMTRALENLIPGTTATTFFILSANVILFALMVVRPFAAPGDDSVPPGAGLMGFDGDTLIRYGSGISFVTLARGEWWRFVTPIFLHGGLIHLVFNSLALVRLGPLVEEEYGTERLAAIYVLTGLAGSAASQVIRHTHTVGASGALCGLLGLLLVHGYRVGGGYGARLKSVMIQNVIIMAGMSLLPRIDWMNHLFGFLAGCVLGGIVPSGSFRSRANEVVWQIAGFVSFVLVLAALAMMATHGADDALWFRSLRGA